MQENDEEEEKRAWHKVDNFICSSESFFQFHHFQRRSSFVHRIALKGINCFSLTDYFDLGPVGPDGFPVVGGDLAPELPSGAPLNPTQMDDRSVGESLLKRERKKSFRRWYDVNEKMESWIRIRPTFLGEERENFFDREGWWWWTSPQRATVGLFFLAFRLWGEKVSGFFLSSFEWYEREGRLFSHSGPLVALISNGQRGHSFFSPFSPSIHTYYSAVHSAVVHVMIWNGWVCSVCRN